MAYEIQDVVEAAKLLNVSEATSADEIKRAYKKLAIKYHPDRSKEPGASDKFKVVSEAYGILLEYMGKGGSLPVSRIKIEGPQNSKSEYFTTPEGDGFFYYEEFEPGDSSVMDKISNFFGRMFNVQTLMSVQGFFGSNTVQVLDDWVKKSPLDDTVIGEVFHVMHGIAQDNPQHPYEYIQSGVNNFVENRKRVQQKIYGEFQVMPSTLDTYKKQSANGTQSAPLFGQLSTDRGVQLGSFPTVLENGDIAVVDGKRYHLRIVNKYELQGPINAT